VPAGEVTGGPVQASARRPAFLITIDTEGDNLWSRPREITTRNVAFLPRFQALCERFGFKPTWLTNYEMAVDPAFVEFARDVLRRGTGEVGMHLHAWNSPPITQLTDDDCRWQPFLIEYPDAAMREKVHVLTSLLEETFNVPVRSHRAGRWAMDERYARVLADRGYTSDCSVTPSISWRRTLGDPSGAGGSDYTRFPEWTYFVDLDDIARPGPSPLLEVPMTTRAPFAFVERRTPGWAQTWPLVRRLLARRAWFRPRPGNVGAMLAFVRRATRERWPYLMFMLHSSEFMPGGSPVFPGARDVDALYGDMETVFAEASPRTWGATMSEWADRFAAERAPGSTPVATR
jgi:hypothetical protein